METKRGKMWVLMCSVLLSSVSNVSPLSLTVAETECVYELVHFEGDMISGNYVVTEKSIVDFSITAPEENIIYTRYSKYEDKFELKAPERGMYAFCFRNKQAKPEKVNFFIHIGHIPNEHNLAKDEHLDPVNVKIATLREALASVTSEQKYLKARDDQHRHTNENTRKRVIGYTVGEYVMLTVVSLLQVVYIRRLFRKTAGRV